jgi:hypothetical protein
MKLRPIFEFFFSLLIINILISCSTSSIRFRYSDPIWKENDTIAIPIPQTTNYKSFDELFSIILRRPVVDALDFSRIKPSQDVNSMDEVPVSSWFNHRLGYKIISPEELLRGPYKYGPPQPPLKITEGKFAGLTPGFIAIDSRGIKYLFKFDPPDFPGIETAAAFIVNRLFWGFGYNVPEDYLYYFSKEQVSVDPEGELTESDVDSILSRVAAPRNGNYRCTASRLIDGVIIGPFSAKGVRKDDPNDYIDHENRRVLRGLRVFGAFTNYTDLRIENTLDVYVGDNGKGYVKHYLLDFGGSLGALSADENKLWEGSNHLFSFKEIAKNLLLAGLSVQEWEELKYTPWSSVGVFESEKYKPSQWKETFPFLPVQLSQAADNYWAAKILGNLTPDHLRALVEAANFPEEEAYEYVLNTLLKRQEKTLEYFLTQVSPLEMVSFSDSKMYLRDMTKVFLKDKFKNNSYKLEYLDAKDNKVAESKTIRNEGNEFQIEIPKAFIDKGDGYLHIEIKTIWDENSASSPVQFHIVTKNNNPPKLVGIVH